MRGTLIRLAAATVGGVMATWLMREGMKHAGRLPERVRPPMPREDPGEFMVRQGERIVGALRQDVHSRAVHGLHWAYGLSGPIALGALSGVLGLRSTAKLLGAGALVGALVWAAGYLGWLPAAGLMPPVHRMPPAKTASSLASHVAYGTLASLPLALAAPRLPA